MTTADLRLVLLLALVVGTLLIFTTCNDAPTVAPDDTSIRAAPGGNPGKPRVHTLYRWDPLGGLGVALEGVVRTTTRVASD